ncbi:UDP-N-acetylmuramoyl-L-alanyl-D-glutamate--2,6-diaminopimelate ligase [Alcanivorax sp. DP30]|uniref:UDP-N-acetylmuramoyl-L-alanyl-D-glutamate--2, 6-diaminopimelate ligase n=1 Tax=Alcanivorax sp. DP30 TaxID=2606217 RepID=UPI001369ECBD|nr:UDP-N-acetylmuramoyl-L-alanyl-D-glutamate--2,6-diaminopimelate ligase [Alcanivorax sp. DP30]MZR62465.1 UDP-N-acetylmuramoyl-L-alanyl-D-glutamate--2,6-diaminopimelate ligase [Alcanivorax sp. DP30]
MKSLQQLLPDFNLPANVAGIVVSGLQLDSRRMEAGQAFLAVPGVASDGRHFVAQAVAAGASVVLADAESEPFSVSFQGQVPCLHVPALAARVGDVAARWFGEPANNMAMIGVTGTNGKTSITWFLRDALNALGHRCALVGTLGVGLKGQELQTGHTTPDPITLQAALASARDAGADCVAMEVSSHALDQGRLGSSVIGTAVFSNLSRDHLDYHGDMESYLAAKSVLFTRDGVRLAVINCDDHASSSLLSCIADGVRCVTFGGQEGATVRCETVAYDSLGMRATLNVAGETVTVSLPLFGPFNLSNLMAVAAILHGQGVDTAALGKALAAVTPVPGRMEPVRAEQGPTVIVDYAHTPDGLEKALQACRAHFEGRLHCIIGCGGDRDTGKRPLMARAAEQLADKVVLTSDNPRGENPQIIIEQMQSGLTNPDQTVAIVERAEAVAETVRRAAAGDVILLAGKGHEDYQDINGVRYPSDDRDLARQALAALSTMEDAQ